MPAENEKARKAASGPMSRDAARDGYCLRAVLLRQAGGVELFQAALRHCGFLRDAGRFSHRLARGDRGCDQELRQTRGAELLQTTFRYLGFEFGDSCRFL